MLSLLANELRSAAVDQISGTSRDEAQIKAACQATRRPELRVDEARNRQDVREGA